MTCKNCEAIDVVSKCCPNCGQTVHLERLTIHYLLHEFSHAVTHADKGILLLVKQLFSRPGYVAKDYVEGKRKKYFNPLSFLVVTSALTAYLTYQAGYYQAFNPNGTYAHPIQKQLMEWVVDYNKVLELILIFPLMAFFTWIYFERKKYTFAECAVLAAFLTGQMNVLRVVVFIPLFLATNLGVQMVDNIFHAVTLVFFIIAFRQFFQQSILLTGLKAILVTVSYILFFWIFTFAAAFIQYSLTN